MVRKKVGGFAFSLCWTTNSWRRKNAKGHHMELSTSWYLSALCFLMLELLKQQMSLRHELMVRRGGGEEWMNGSTER